METPLVSILVITYNHGHFISKCLDGIFSQQVDFNVEVLIGDDCSSDITRDIIQSYKEKHPNIKLYMPDKNIFSTGMDMFITHLIPKAKGKYIAFCEGDDFWTNPRKLQQQVTFLENNRSYSMCFHNHHVLENGKLSAKFRAKKDCDVTLSELLCLGLCQTATTVGTASALKSDTVLRYYSHPLHTYGDINFFTAWAVSGKIRMFADSQSVYRRHCESVTANDERQNLVKQKHIQGLSALRDTYGIKGVRRNYFSTLLLGKSSRLTRRKRYISAIALKIMAFLISPIFTFNLYHAKYRLN